MPQLLASGGIFLNASAGGTIVDGEIHSTNGNIDILVSGVGTGPDDGQSGGESVLQVVHHGSS